MLLSLPLSLNGQDKGYYYYRYYIDPIALAIVVVALGYPSGDCSGFGGTKLTPRTLSRGIGAYRGTQSNLL